MKANFYLQSSFKKKIKMVGATKKFLLFNILFFYKVCLYVRINSILKVMCIFSRCELFIIAFVQELVN